MWKKWQPTAVFLPEKFYGQRSPSGYSPRIAKNRTQLSNWAHLFVVFFFILPHGAKEQELKKQMLDAYGMSTRPVTTRCWEYERGKGHNISFSLFLHMIKAHFFEI